MTTGPFATHPLAFGHGLHLELGRARAIILALLATLSVALVAPSALQAGRPLAANSGRTSTPRMAIAVGTITRGSKGCSTEQACGR